MIEKTIRALEFDKILNMLSETAFSENAKQKLLNLRPYLSKAEVNAKLKETTEARKILDSMGTPPLPNMKDIEKILELTEIGSMLLPEQLNMAAQFISACLRIKGYLKRAESLRVDIAYYGNSLQDLDPLLKEINLAIRGTRVEDSASKDLRDIRRKIEHVNTEIKAKLESLLRSKKEWFTEGFISSRNGHFVLPVKKEYKNQVSGSTLDISSTGATYFIVPSAVLKLEDELSLLKMNEDNEERKILYTLTSLVHNNTFSIKINMEALETLDFIFAKAKLSLNMKGVPALINNERYIQIRNGRHPLLNASECVPLNFTIGKGMNGVIITGPNTGGKTVALKTVGLLQLMAQCGLHIPCESSELCMNNLILCDIGDGQSITENLSTFSAHISNIINILNHTGKESLILLDELGSGTDPAEGMGIAIAILEELKAKNCLFLATTHYPEVKDYADKTEGFINARMAFDRESLKPLYQLEIGEAGESCALYIAKRLGMPKRMLEKAYEEAYLKNTNTLPQNVPDTSFLDDANEGTNSAITDHIIKEKPEKTVSTRSMRFHIGDSVVVYPGKKIGIVYKTANEKGEIGVQIQKQKQLVSHKRLQLKASASDMYPEDYDFSIIFDTVENRKARNKMEKGYRPDLKIVYEKEDL
ncbi:MAG: DNA mismatch repair protein MutS [Anaerocolumna sp.]